MSWQSVKLSEICPSDAPITYGILQPGPIVPGGVPYVRPSEIQDGQIDLNSIRRTTPEIAAKYKKSAIAEGDVLITIVGTIGSIAMVPPELHGANITQSSARVRVCEKKASRDYIKHYLRSPLAIHQYDRHRLGVAVPRLNLHHVRDLEIPLPPLAEQKRIAGILDAADALRAKRREALAQLDTLLQSTFLDMFGDPVTNPKGWVVRELGTLARFINGDRGKNYPSKSDFVPSGVPFINAGHLKGGQVRFEEMNYITRERFDRLGSGKTEKGDLIYCLRGSLGKTAVVDHSEDSAIASSLVILRTGDDCLPTFLYQYLVSPYGQQEIRRFDNGSSQPNLSAASVKKYAVPLPPIDLQQHFADFAESIEQQRRVQQVHLAELDTLFASLQSRAFRGEL